MNSNHNPKDNLHYRHLADAMPQIVWTARPDGYVDYYNQRWFDYTGLTQEQTEGWGWQPVLHPDDVERSLRRWAKAVITGEVYEIEYRFRRAADGAYRWHLGRAVPMRDENADSMVDEFVEQPVEAQHAHQPVHREDRQQRDSADGVSLITC